MLCLFILIQLSSYLIILYNSRAVFMSLVGREIKLIRATEFDLRGNMFGLKKKKVSAVYTMST